ncbi:hypothetical protein EI427_14005 [Flammeovirga pectinis]|uniref:NACHT N-terminal helical domain-containing protein n=1 Tax=Flammeovirga pectinis TaxID=2494373 RepID=A0A3S9P5H1_9BACT|nr:hypothetical protein [Flammeovirga pectinis]AZQ63312.1 hypothetical protein EI427_14005 [Flammeovirga pectinis]
MSDVSAIVLFLKKARTTFLNIRPYLEKKYFSIFRLFKMLKINSSLINDRHSIFNHSLYQYEQKKGKELASLFKEEELLKVIENVCISGHHKSLESKVEDILFYHNPTTLDSLKVNFVEEVSLFMEIFKENYSKSFSLHQKELRETNKKVDSKVDDVLINTEEIGDGIDRLQNDSDSILQKLDEDKQIDFSLFKQSFSTDDLQTLKRYIPRSYYLLEENQDSNFYQTYSKNETDLQSIILDKKRVLILGNGGIGKTVELKRLKLILEENNNLYSFYYSFLRYTGKTMSSLLPKNWESVQGSLVVILDGLDEVRSSDFNIAVREIISFSENCPNVKIVISCRTNHLISDSILGDDFTNISLAPLSLYSEDVKLFVQKYYNINLDEFREQIYLMGYTDLVDNPFYLSHLLDDYSDNGQLNKNRKDLFDALIEKNIKYDKDKYVTTHDKKHFIRTTLRILEQLALSMELYQRSSLEEDELEQFLDEDTEKFQIIQYTKFYKKDTQLVSWEFDHRLFQEYLSAKALCRYSFERIISFITYQNWKKVKPSWINITGFLISVIENEQVRSKLIDWLINNDPDSIVTAEKEVIPTELRVKVFKKIFKRTKKYQVWLNSNKFNESRLANFGQSDEIIHYLKKQITNKKNNLEVKSSAIRIFQYFDFKGKGHSETCDFLMTEIKTYVNDLNQSVSEYVANCIQTLTKIGIDNKFANQLIQTVCYRNYQSIRSSIYSLIKKNNLSNDNIQYLIRGFKITKKIFDDDEIDRIPNYHTGEESQILECFLQVKFPKTLKILIQFFIEFPSYELTTSHSYNNFIEKIIKLSSKLYHKDPDLTYQIIMNWYCIKMRYYGSEEGLTIRYFFELTSTNDIALIDLINDQFKTKDSFEKANTIAYIITNDNVSEVISAVLENKIDCETTISIYDTLINIDNNLAQSLKDGICQKFSILSPHKQKNIYTEIKEKDFNLLFTPKELKDKIISAYKLAEKSQFSKTEIRDMHYYRKEISKLQYFDSNLVFEILEKFVNEKKEVVTLQEVRKWLDNTENVEKYLIRRLYNTLLREDFNKRLNDSQKKWVVDWVNKNISKIKFSTAITFKSDDSFSVNYLAQWVYFFSLKLNLRHSNSIILDMLLFVWTDSEENNSNINYINNWVSSELIIERMLINLRLGIKSSIIRKKHLKYLLEEGIVESYSFIVSEILNEDDNTFLISYWEKTKNIEVFKELFTKSNSEIKWRILDILLEQGEFSFCLKQLKTLLHNHHSQEEALTILKYLISIGNIDGLKRFIKYLNDNDFHIDKGFKTSHLTFSLDALPHLMELLEMCYKHDITFGYQENLYLSVYNLIKSTALLSEKNYSVVREKLQAFLDLNHKKYKYVKYLNHRLQELDQEFYKNNTITLTIAEVKEQISIKN